MPKQRPANRTRISGKQHDRRLVFAAFLILLLVFGGLFVRLYQKTEPALLAPAVEQSAEPAREVLLYFATPDATRLVAENREIPGCTEELDCLRSTVQALLHGPVTDLAPILPSHAVLRDLSVTDSLLTVDFDAAFIAGHPGGTQGELLSIHGLVDTIAVNFPHIRQVRFLVDGQPIDTLKGHVDLRQPVMADFSLVEESSAPLEQLQRLEPQGEGQ
ncbi:MAG: GerMN domain-containing protein [Desulfuromonadales bacterium]|nr:GerMN domain-containing protein [Desulfuromonadales bacterium]